MFSATATSETDLKPTQKPKPLPLINEDDDNNNIFSKLLSKDMTSMANPSFRVYYGSGAAGSVPFIWESQPGTPKHYVHSLFSGDQSLPPLTPPPSSFREKTLETGKLHEAPVLPANSSTSMFRRLLKKVSLRKTSSGPILMPERVKSTTSDDYGKRRQFLNRGSSFDSVFIDAEEDEDRGSSYFCFQLGNSKRGSTRW